MADRQKIRISRKMKEKKVILNLRVFFMPGATLRLDRRSRIDTKF
jgi:hypothetical protein